MTLRTPSARLLVGRTITEVRFVRIPPADDPGGRGFTIVQRLVLDSGAQLLSIAYEIENGGPEGSLLYVPPPKRRRKERGSE